MLIGWDIAFVFVYHYTVYIWLNHVNCLWNKTKILVLVGATENEEA
jgi:hypothetical protein